MAKRLKVKDHPDLVKEGGVIINSNHDAFLAYHQRKKILEDKKTEHQEMKERLEKLEALIAELTSKKDV